MLVTANMLISPAGLSFAGELFCQVNAKLGRGVLAMVEISDAAFLVVLYIHSHRRSCHLLHPLGPQYSQNQQLSSSVIPFGCHLLNQPRNLLTSLHCVKREVLQWAQVFWYKGAFYSALGQGKSQILCQIYQGKYPVILLQH